MRSIANEQPLSRYAYTVSKRVGNAVVRNRVKRRLREAMRSLPVSEGYDIVLTTRPEAAQATFWLLREELARLLGRAKLLDASPSTPELP